MKPEERDRILMGGMRPPVKIKYLCPKCGNEWVEEHLGATVAPLASNCERCKTSSPQSFNPLGANPYHRREGGWKIR